MSNRSEEFISSSIRFIREQDGVPERQLKSKLREYFEMTALRGRAYLTQVEYAPSSDLNVALCFGSLSPIPHSLAAQVGDIFSQMFRTDEHLDVIFLSVEQEKEMRLVATPFYSGSNLTER